MLALRPDANDEIEKTLSLLGLKRHIALALPLECGGGIPTWH
ncbi:hypothetical protein [Xenorhabdus sp. SGI246]